MWLPRRKNRKIPPPIIMLSSGRTGSTLLQRIINTSGNIVMWGEHNAMLNGIADSYFNVLYSDKINNKYYSRKSQVPPSTIIGSFTEYREEIFWLNPFEKDKTQRIYKEFIFALFNQGINLKSNIKWGFKEIRYTMNDKTLEMLVELFPDSKFIFSIRNPLDVILSMMLVFYPKEERNKAFEDNNLNPVRENMLEFAKSIYLSYLSFDQWTNDKRINSLIIRHEDLIGNQKETIDKLFNFMDEPVSSNAFEPLNYLINDTLNVCYRQEMTRLIVEETPNISQIFGDLPEKFGYSLNLSDT